MISLVLLVTASVTISPIETDTTSRTYAEQQFQYYREMFNNNINVNDSLAEVATTKALYYGKVLNVDSFKRAAIFLNAGVFCSRRTQDIKRAIVFFKQAIDFCPRTSVEMRRKIIGNLGVTYYTLMELDSSLKYYRQAITLCNDIKSPCIAVRNNLASIYSMSGNYAEALQLLSPIMVYLQAEYPSTHLDEDMEGYSSIPVAIGNLVSYSIEAGELMAAGYYMRYGKTVLTNNRYDRRYRLSILTANAQLLAATGEMDAAIQAFHEILDLVGEEPLLSGRVYQEVWMAIEAFATCCVDYSWEHEYGNALAALNRLGTPMDRMIGSIYQTKGRLFLGLGQSDSARFYMSKASIINKLHLQEVDRAGYSLKEISRLKLPADDEIEMTQSTPWGWLVPSILGISIISAAFGIAMARRKRKPNE